MAVVQTTFCIDTIVPQWSNKIQIHFPSPFYPLHGDISTEHWRSFCSAVRRLRERKFHRIVFTTKDSVSARVSKREREREDAVSAITLHNIKIYRQMSAHLVDFFLFHSCMCPTDHCLLLGGTSAVTHSQKKETPAEDSVWHGVIVCP